MPTQIHPWNPELELCDVKHEIRQEIARIVASVFPGQDIRGMTLPGRLCLTEQEVGLAMKATGGGIQFDAIDFNLIPTIPTSFQNSMLTNGKDGKYKRALHTQANAAYTMTGYKGDFFKVQNNIYNDPKLGDAAGSFIYFDGCGNALGQNENTVQKFIDSITECAEWLAPCVQAVTFSLNCRGYTRERTINDLVGIDYSELKSRQVVKSNGNFIPTYQAVADAIQQHILLESIVSTGGQTDVRLAYRRDYKNGSSPMTTMVFVICKPDFKIEKSSYDWMAYDWDKKFFQYSNFRNSDVKESLQQMASDIHENTGLTGKELGIEIGKALPIHPWQASSMAAWFHPNLKKLRKKV